MVAYSFKPSFVAPILAETKMQTIRNMRKRHARQGEELQLYLGMRTRNCRLIARTICTETHDIRLDFEHGEVTLDDAICISDLAALDAFALADGFGGSLAERASLSAWDHMSRWWALTHGQDVFRGVLIQWGRLIERGAA